MPQPLENALLQMRPGRIKYVGNYAFALFLIGFYFALNSLEINVHPAINFFILATPVLLILGSEVDRIATLYQLTPSRLIIEGGIGHKQRTSMLYHHIADINLYQSVFERMFGYGHLKIHFITAEGVELNYIKHPNNVGQYLEKLVQYYSLGKHEPEWAREDEQNQGEEDAQDTKDNTNTDDTDD